MRTETIPYAGWDQCIRIHNDTVELVVTTQVGPRIIRYGFIDAPNEFVEYPDQVGQAGGDVYRSYGGHRLWAAPEVKGWTNHPDNEPVDVSNDGREVVFSAVPERGTGFRKQIGVTLGDTGSAVRIRHILTNTGDRPVECALWALSVMAPGGTAILPQEGFISHAEKVLPARPLALWHYTDMSDPRWTWGRRFIRLRQSAGSRDPQKAGVLTSDGWAAHARDGRMFIKRFPFDESAVYPDHGVNVEVFTNYRMLEVESLGALAPLLPGESREHVEDWSLHTIGDLPSDEEMLKDILDRLLS